MPLSRYKIIKELKSQGHSCLTCNSTKYAYGDVIKCEAQANKFVSPHDLCVFHQELLARSLAEIKQAEAELRGD